MYNTPGKYADDVNSDDPKVLSDFLDWALPQCAPGAKYVLTMSGHGGGYQGFGGDETNGNHFMTNDGISSAIRGSLKKIDVVALDMLGFDACQMGSYVVASEYARGTPALAKMYLASEANEPNAGWAYDAINWNSFTDSVEDYALSIVDTYAHDTLVLIRADHFGTFSGHFQNLCSNMAEKLGAGDDNTFNIIQAARAECTSFLDSRVDVRDFLENLNKECGDCEFMNLIHNASSSYTAMVAPPYFATSVGEPYSGLALFFRTREEVKKSPGSDDEGWFPERYADTSDAHIWDDFLVAYYEFN